MQFSYSVSGAFLLLVTSHNKRSSRSPGGLAAHTIAELRYVSYFMVLAFILAGTILSLRLLDHDMLSS